MQFQATPGGTGAYLDRLMREGVETSTTEIEVEPWTGEVPSSDQEIAFLPVHRLAALIQARKLSAIDLTDIYLERLERLDPKLFCVVNLMKESAREAAKKADREISAGRYRGPLHGIPWGVKDLFATRGVPTTWGVKPYQNRILDVDAAVVTRLRDAGAILLAKLTTGGFASGDRWFGGQTRNPWNLEQGSSGSSAGPASATAAGCVGFAIGTETLGSILSPARRCGISALRPTYGRVSRYGCMTLSWSMDKAGPMCRTIEDCALVFSIIHGVDQRDPATVTVPFHWQRSPDLSALRIGYTNGTDVDFLDQLRELGANPVEVGDRPRARGISVLPIESNAAFEDFFTKYPNEESVASTRAARRYQNSRDIPAVEYLQSQRRRIELMREMADFMADLDMYVSRSGDSNLTNHTGHPAAVIPYAFEDDQPRCMTIVGSLFADDELLSVAHAYQTATSWHRSHPSIS